VNAALTRECARQKNKYGDSGFARMTAYEVTEILAFAMLRPE
jgi:hypothetical protein